jgi:hypothetical protein
MAAQCTLFPQAVMQSSSAGTQLWSSSLRYRGNSTAEMISFYTYIIAKYGNRYLFTTNNSVETLLWMKAQGTLCSNNFLNSSNETFLSMFYGHTDIFLMTSIHAVPGIRMCGWKIILKQGFRYFTHLKCQKPIGDDVGDLKYVFYKNYQPDTFYPTYYARIWLQMP